MIRQSVKDAYFQAARYLTLPSTIAARARYGIGKPRVAEGYSLHLGCGFKYIPGMINVDGNVFRKIDLWHDLRNKLPFPDQSCRLVYSSHTLEHLFPEEAMMLLREIRRVLSEEGVARIAVPSMEHALAVAMGQSSDPEDWPRRFADPASQAINYLFCDGQHKYGYTFDILRAFATEAGFSTVRNYSAEHGVAPKQYGHVTVGDEPPGSLVVELAR
ncbi:hypothetical protein BH23PLA1_BH23PLA1_11080 [soil metagenome]